VNGLQIKEFAARLLLSPNLEDKLSFPAVLSDDDLSGCNETIAEPARCEKLSLVPRGREFKFGEFKALSNDAQRGRCLHFFANHELQAIELMALALLKFPDAPKGLRKHLVATIQDEQKHTKLYMKRMEQCGIVFGEDGLNRFFWDALKGMSSIDAFIAGMSLTLEQANLDFCCDFKQRFQQVGDQATADILTIVLNDEMRHVRLGLEYFKKEHADHDGCIWPAYVDKLEAPLFPSRAKAQPFQKKIRESLGFHTKDIEALFTYQRSKGRPPDVYLYNSFEHDFSNKGTSQKLKDSLHGDFQALPLWLAKKDDLIVLKHELSADWLRHLTRSSVVMPEVVIQSSDVLERSSLTHQHIGAIKPWAPTKSVEEMFKHWNQISKKPFEISTCAQNSESNDSKLRSCELLQQFFEDNADPRFGNPVHSLGLWVDSTSDLIKACRQIQKWGYAQAMLKAPFGCAGQNVKRMEHLDAPESWPMQWIQEKLDSQVSLWLQPLFDRCDDFAWLGKIEAEKIDYLGSVHAITSLNGRYYGHSLGASWPAMSEAVKPFLWSAKDPLWEKWKHQLMQILAQKTHYFCNAQNLGIDAFLYKDLTGELKLFPLVELNSRTTFGHIALSLNSKMAQKAVGIFWLCPVFKDKELYSPWLERGLEVEATKWKSGLFFLSDPYQCVNLLPVCAVAETLAQAALLLRGFLSKGDAHINRSLTPLLSRLKM